MQNTILKNGLKIIYKEKPSNAVVIQVMIKVGSNHEEPNERGIMFISDKIIFPGFSRPIIFPYFFFILFCPVFPEYLFFLVFSTFYLSQLFTHLFFPGIYHKKNFPAPSFSRIKNIYPLIEAIY